MTSHMSKIYPSIDTTEDISTLQNQLRITHELLLKIQNDLEFEINKNKRLECIKHTLEYRLGSIMISTKWNLFKMLMLPYLMIREYMKYKKANDD